MTALLPVPCVWFDADDDYKDNDNRKVVPYLITSTGLGADPGFLAVSLQMTYGSHKPGSRLPLLSTRPAVTFPAKEITYQTFSHTFIRHCRTCLSFVCVSVCVCMHIFMFLLSALYILGWYHIITAGDRGTMATVTKATTQWCPARTWTHDLWIASPLPCQ